MLYNFTATPQSLKVQLWEGGIDYTEIQPFQLFYTLLYKAFPIEKTSIIFGDLDFSKFQVRQKDEDGSIFLYQAIPTGNIYELIGSNIKGKKLHHFTSLTDAGKFVNADEDTLINQLSEDINNERLTSIYQTAMQNGELDTAIKAIDKLNKSNGVYDTEKPTVQVQADDSNVVITFGGQTVQELGKPVAENVPYNEVDALIKNTLDQDAD